MRVNEINKIFSKIWEKYNYFIYFYINLTQEKYDKTSQEIIFHKIKEFMKKKGTFHDKTNRF